MSLKRSKHLSVSEQNLVNDHPQNSGFAKPAPLKVSGLSVLRKTATMIKKHDLVLANDKMTVSSEKSPQKKSLCTSSEMKNSITTCIYVHVYV